MIYSENSSQVLLLGDCLSILKKLPASSVNCCVTSPPYFGLRDYGCDGQIGLEATPDAFVARLVEVFREVRRVLRDDGTLWLNLGDSYAAKPTGNFGTKSALNGIEGESYRKRIEKGHESRRGATLTGLPDKNLIGIPWRVAFALQADGWYLRQDIIWHKPNPMPESVKDRCTKAHEYIFLLSKSPKYYFDNEAIKEPIAVSTRLWGGGKKGFGKSNVKHSTPTATHGPSARGEGRCGENGEMRNKRSVWTVATKPFKGSHFATFPPDLIEPCVLAGCPENGVVLDPFNGAGTVGVVSFKNNRNYVGIELNPEYCRITVERWAKNGNQN